MSWFCSSNAKNCASCAYWGGVREVKGSQVNTKSYSEKGKCLAPKGGYRNRDRQCNATCKDFFKWPVLK